MTVLTGVGLRLETGFLNFNIHTFFWTFFFFFFEISVEFPLWVHTPKNNGDETKYMYGGGGFVFPIIIFLEIFPTDVIIH